MTIERTAKIEVSAAYGEDMIARGLKVYVGINAQPEMIPVLLAGRASVRQVLGLLDGGAGVWWGVMSDFGDLVDFEDYAWSDGLLAETHEDLEGGDVSIVLIAKRPTRNGEPWDPEVHNPPEAGGLMGNSYLREGEQVELVEVRYDAGKGWVSLPATGIRAKASAALTWEQVQARYPVYAGQGFSSPESSVMELALGASDWDGYPQPLTFTEEEVRLRDVRFTRYERSDSRMESIRGGYLDKSGVPPVLLVRRAGELLTVDGHHRLSASEDLGMDVVRAVVAQSPRQDRYSGRGAPGRTASAGQTVTIYRGVRVWVPSEESLDFFRKTASSGDWLLSALMNREFDADFTGRRPYVDGDGVGVWWTTDRTVAEEYGGSSLLQPNDFGGPDFTFGLVLEAQTYVTDAERDRGLEFGYSAQSPVVFAPGDPVQITGIVASWPVAKPRSRTMQDLNEKRHLSVSRRVVAKTAMPKGPLPEGLTLHNIIHPAAQSQVAATVNGKVVGVLQYWGGNSGWHIASLWVDKPHRRYGIAKAMHDWLEEIGGKPVLHGEYRSPNGDAWAKNVGQPPPGRKQFTNRDAEDEGQDAADFAQKMLDAGTHISRTQKLGMPSWRDRGTRPEAEALIVPDLGRSRGNSYEVFLYGQPHARRDTLEAAKATVEDVYGPLTWQQVPGDPEPHYDRVHGWTTMFNDAERYYLVERLPRLGEVVSRHGHDDRADDAGGLLRGGSGGGRAGGRRDHLGARQDLVLSAAQVTRIAYGPVRDQGLLESAVGQQQWHEDIFDRAAALAYSIVSNHPLVDGNKRTAWVSARTLLRMAGYRLKPRHAEAVRVMVGLADGSVSRAQFSSWLRGTSRVASLVTASTGGYYHVSGESNRASIEQHGLRANGDGGVWLYSDPERVRGIGKSWTPGHPFEQQDVWLVDPVDVMHGTQARDQYSADEWYPDEPIWVTYTDVPPSRVRRVDNNTLTAVAGHTTASLEAALDETWTPLYGDWRKWATVHTSDQDALVAIDLLRLRTARPANREVSDEDLLAHLNQSVASITANMADPKVQAAVEEFLDRDYVPGLTQGDATDVCDIESDAFAALLESKGVACEVVNGFKMGEFMGHQVILQGHVGVRVGSEVYDWTARQFDPSAPVPQVTSVAAWNAAWGPLKVGSKTSNLAFYSREWRWQDWAKRNGHADLIEKTTLPALRRYAQKCLDAYGVTAPLEISVAPSGAGYSEGGLIDGKAHIAINPDEKNRWNALHECSHVICDFQGMDRWDSDHGPGFQRVFPEVLRSQAGIEVNLERNPPQRVAAALT